MAIESIKISFGTKRFDAIICLDTKLPEKSIFAQFPEIPILAADGAAIKLAEMDLIPDFIVGDLDTFYSSPISASIADKTKIIKEPEQDSNDFEKVLRFAKTKKFNTLLIFGFHGGELEHTLNNWSVFMRFAREMNLCIYDEKRYGIPVFNSFSIELKKGEMISLIPQPKAVLTTKGLAWELDNEILELGEREGARNIASQGTIEIKIYDGSLLIFVDERIPFSPSFKL
jgi:thiamine pyrophosphokinase